MRASRSISIFLIISFIAVFMYGDLFTNEADADCDGGTIASQIGFGYLAGGAVVAGMCAILVEVEKYTKYKLTEDSGVAAVIIGPAAFVIASSGTVYGIGQIAGCRGSFRPTLVGGAILTPVVGGIIGGIIGGIKNDDGCLGSFIGSSVGFLLAPIGATIAYHLTKEENNPGKKEIIVPLMRMRF